MTKKLIVSGDWHLDAVTAGVERFADVAAAAYAAVARATELKAEGADVKFLFAGDLSDPEPPRCWRAVELATSIVMTLDANDVDSFWITGNHDVLEDGHGSSTLRPLTPITSVFDGPGFLPIFDGVWLVCLPYVPRTHAYSPAEFVASLPPALSEPGQKVVVLSHLMIEGIEPGSETSDFARGRDIFLPIAEIVERFPEALMFNGHYHARQNFRGVWLPGSLARLTRLEAANTPAFYEVTL